MDTIAAFMVALGFDVNQGSLNTAKKSIADYEKAVRDAEKRVEDARWEGAKSAEEISKLTREANLKEARAALAAAEQREKAEKDAAQKRKKHNDEFMAGMSRLALAATAMATAVSYAANRVAQSFDHLGFVSARTGASVQSINSLSYAFRQTGGSAQQAVGAVESFAKAIRENSGVKSYVQSLGVDMTKDTAQQLLDTVEALNKQPYDVGFRQAGLAGISEEDYNLISRQLGKIKEYRAEYNATTKALGIDSAKAAEASMAFQRTLSRLQATISALSDKLMVSLAPALERILKGFNDWIAANPGKVDEILTGISNAAIWLATKLGDVLKLFTGSNGDEFMKKWEAFGTRMRQFADNVDRIASGIEKIARFLSWSSGTNTVLGSGQRTADLLNEMRTGGAVGYATPGTVKDDRRWYEKILPRGMGGKDAPAPIGGVPSGSRAGSLTALIEAEARKAGIDPRIMHGIRAGESGHGSHYDKVDNSIESSWGPYQLNRKKGLGVEFERETGLDVRDPKTIPDQTRWVAQGLAKNGRKWLRNWMGYKGDRDSDPKWGESGYAPTPDATGNNQVAGGAHPLAGAGRMSSDFGMRRHPITGDMKMHAGIDLAAPAGTNVQAMTAGLVTIGASGDVTIKQGDGASTTYRHVVPNVADGARVAAGQVIAQLRRHDSRSTGPHLHFEARDKDGNLMDPKGLLGAAPASERARAAANDDTTKPRIVPRMDPGGFDVNAIMKPNPAAALNVVNNGGASNRAVHQTFNQNTTINGSENPRQAARIMESAFGNMHSLALQNAQSAVA
ncbi:peptidoglycan DD-metalloendopeptidase family protein [Methylobacterium sp. WL18]|uniref:M23 family metallopeptidase n=1 Tax=Methylobacterium sp. WL18 TaxID=2603897 RepID=UPI0011CABD13|nr:M23 family metallopeptidase [Methylobacterium sp. WL18]TXN76163.1 peptidoglycan DD-metalloendopeptidase family protein [Methylobacterium sp. WL18]